MQDLALTPSTVVILLVIAGLAVLAVRRLLKRGLCDCGDHCGDGDPGCSGCSSCSSCSSCSGCSACSIGDLGDVAKTGPSHPTAKKAVS